MSKIDIISGFLGAGKTTLIKKLIEEVYTNEKIVLIENEFGEIGIDGTFLQDSGITINEMNSGCICCSLVGDFEASLKEVLDTYHPDRVIIEPSGVGKLSDVIKAVSKVKSVELELENFITVVDAKKCRMYTKNFGEFYNNQVEAASLIVLSRTQDLSEFQLNECLNILKGLNDHSPIITTPWDKLNGQDIIDACRVNLEDELLHDEECKCGHHHDHHHDEECKCGHHHEHHNDEECGCGHHHHHHDEECGCEHHHEHHNNEECGCGHHHEHHHDEECGCGHHHHHHADEVFNSIGLTTIKKYSKDELNDILAQLSQQQVLRAKGFVDSGSDNWWYFDLVPEEFEIRTGKPMYTGQVCVIGKDVDEETVKDLFLGH